jgi:hypothetical protein
MFLDKAQVTLREALMALRGLDGRLPIEGDHCGSLIPVRDTAA